MSMKVAKTLSYSDTGKTGHMPRVIKYFDVCTCHFDD